MSLSRREFLLATLGAAALEACGSSSNDGGDDGGDGDGDGSAEAQVMDLPIDKASFAHGIASGDPFQDSVLLWTRFTPKSEETIKLVWAITRDPELSDVVVAGWTEANKDHDFTVKVIAEGLTPGTTYYYAFFLPETSRSVVGRTRTLPAETDHVRFAYTSCANFGNGYFHAYRNIAKRNDLDVWVHLGDYIYEYSEADYSDPTIDRPLDPKTEALSLSDYRRRYAHYKGDLDLQEIHRQHPLIAVWDDHEVADNSWKDGAYNHQPATEGDYATRKAGALKAYLEWLPIRVEETTGTPHIYRQFAFGKLFDLIMLDTRHLARDKQAGTDQRDGLVVQAGDPQVWIDPKRTILGTEQETWFTKALSDSKARGASWRIIGNQIIFSRANNPLTKDARGQPGILFSDFWDGYQVSQAHIMNHIVDSKIGNVVFLTGDIHTSWAFDVIRHDESGDTYDPSTGKGSIAVELVGPSVTSQALEDETADFVSAAESLIKNANKHLFFYDVTQKGYVLVDITKERLQAEWYFMADIKKLEGSAERLAASYECKSGTPHLLAAKTATAAKAGAPAMLTEE